jgi:cell division protein FtsL
MISSATILFIACLAVVYGVMYSTTPNITLDKEKKFSRWKAVLYALLVSFVFTLTISIFSFYIDNEYAKTTKVVQKNSS